MFRKRSLFFRIRHLLQYLHRGVHRWGILLLLLATFLGTGILPPAFVTAQNSIVRGVLNAEELFQQGKNLYAAEQFNQASLVFEQALIAFQAEGDKLRQAMTLSNLSLTYQQLGQWSKASQAIRNAIASLHAQSLNLLQTGPHSQRQILAQALDIQGRLQLAQGKAESALNTWQQAAAIYAKIDDKTGLIRSRINSTQALQTLGNYRQAQKTLTEINQNLQNQPDSTLKATGLRSLGNVLRVVGDLEQSRKILQQSLEVATRIQLQSPQVISETWLSLGNTATAQQDTPAALNYYQRAAATSTSTTRIQAELNQLRLLLDDNQLNAAQALVSQIQAQIPNLPASRKAIYARINFAQSLMKLKAKGVDGYELKQIAQLVAIAVQQAKDLQDQRSVAYALGNLAGLYEHTQQYGSAQDLTQQALVISQAINVPDITYRWQWQLGRLLKARGDIKGAIAAYSESVKILQSLRNDLVAINPEVQFSFRDEVEPIYRQLVNLLLQSQPSQDNLVQARAVIESLQLAELDNFFRVACLEGRPVQIDSVIDRQDPTAAVIYPIILADKLEVILKLPQQPLRHYKTSISASEVERIVDQLRQEAIKPYTLRQTQLLSKQIYNWLLQPAQKYLAQSQIKTLVFVLDGSLRNIPMAVLYDGQQYLIEKYAIALTPGLQLLAPKSLSQQKIKALTAGITEARQGFSPLSNVALELNQIKSELPTTVLLNQKFTSETFQKEINSVPFTVVHLATHGQFSSKVDETFILTWDGRINVNQLDTLLRIRNTEKPNAIELLVLSACQTAAGDKRATLGLAGIAVRAGARSTLASLWNLDDESTAELMSQFYRELTSKQLTKAEALRQAQLALLKNPKYQHPIFWAPYVLVGNWL
ncbi:CHAT domain-containing protein [Nostocaceae cyanobacterium CENA369]|uniref:CHAT domain-containing protein n=1 Tax=Dendronalium phyllosphericum CENA369 TaxID=1725256 RepID=A0A8J7LDS2_9NOST|nr:CHAT domain-containing protein [Dendronalium phyllosphericum]MBH8572233.1 CHAT domain-containing protein [Dendronalium phyllosphericum CENA369]